MLNTNYYQLKKLLYW